MALAGKNVLVTGGCGFIGAHLVEKLVSIDANVIVSDQVKNPFSYFYKNRLDQRSTFVETDIKNFKKVFDIITKYEINYVFHSAAQSVVTTAYKNPLETFESNILGTANILESCRLYEGIDGIVVITSDKAYGKNPRAKETDPLEGDHPYESSKSAADLIAKTYFVTYKLPVAVARLGNTYGEGDLNFSRIVPGIMEALSKNKVLQVRSNGKFVRDYVYVGDVVDSLIKISNNMTKAKGEAFNVSSYENLSVIELIKKVSQILKKKINYKILNNAANEIPVQSINFNKIKKQLGWRPEKSLKLTIPSIYNWYQEYFSDHLSKLNG